VPGAGPVPSEIMIVGEAPGFNEDVQGVPFVGAAGKLLDTLLGQIGLTRQQVFIANVLKCRPPQNRDPMPHEAETCLRYLRRQFALVRPRAVLILGRHALERMLPGVGGISRVHGQIFMRSGVAFMPCYHPAAALHNGGLLADLQRDFDRVREYLDRLLAVPEPEPAPAAEAAPEPAAVAPSPQPDPEQLPLI
jgi:uracil-DNA glycosylase